MPWRLQSEPTTVERIVGGVSYLTAGIVGLLYMLLSKNGGQSTQFRFHTFQSMFLAIIFVLFRWAVTFLNDLTGPMLLAIGGDTGRLLYTGVAQLFGILTTAFSLLFLYGAIMAFLGKFAEVPFVSNIVRYNMRV